MYQSIDEVRQAYSRGEKLDFWLFWGHTPAKDGSIGAPCLSQWWGCEFSENGIEYTSAEQYMMAGKARLFDDRVTLGQILDAHDPKAVKALGRKVRNFDGNAWKASCQAIVKRGNFLKFSQNAELKGFLLSTGEKILVEASPYDRIWGIGMGKDDEFAGNPLKWRGQNLLGFSLMSARDEIRKNLQEV